MGTDEKLMSFCSCLYLDAHGPFMVHIKLFVDTFVELFLDTFELLLSFWVFWGCFCEYAFG